MATKIRQKILNSTVSLGEKIEYIKKRAVESEGILS
jgi:hypothetical protein